MVAHIDDRFLVGCCHEFAIKSVVALYGVRMMAVTFPWKLLSPSLIASSVAMSYHLIVSRRIPDIANPEGPPCRQCPKLLVSNWIFLSTYCQLTFVDAVGISSNCCSEVAWTLNRVGILF